jgi:hypothetical protein
MNIKFSRDGKELAEYPEEAVRALLQSNVLRASDSFWHQGMTEWASVDSRWASEPPPIPGNRDAGVSRAACPICQKGQLALAKKFRMSTPVVVIGWLLLIPSFLGMLVGLIGVFATGTAATTTSTTIDKEARSRLEAENVPAAIIDGVIAGRTITEDQKSGLSESQRSAVSAASLSLAAGRVGAGAGTAIAGGFSIAVIVMSFIGGLLGWLLVMKKKVLECPVCGAVVPAS